MSPIPFRRAFSPGERVLTRVNTRLLNSRLYRLRKNAGPGVAPLSNKIRGFRVCVRTDSVFRGQLTGAEKALLCIRARL